MIVFGPSEPETLIEQLTLPEASVTPLQVWPSSVNVTVWPAGEGGGEPPSPSSSFAPSSTSVAVTVSVPPVRITVGPVYVSVVSSRVIVNGALSELGP